jgi:hypothetical protein
MKLATIHYQFLLDTTAYKPYIGIIMKLIPAKKISIGKIYYTKWGRNNYMDEVKAVFYIRMEFFQN